MLKTIDTTTLETLLTFGLAHDFHELRAQADAIGLTPLTAVKATDLDLALEVRDLMRNHEADFGAHGKSSEASARLHETIARGARWFRWRDLTARPTSRVDMLTGAHKAVTEHKSGCGDWLRSMRYSTRDEIVDEYSKRETLIDWHYELAGFHIVATWHDFLAYLGEFKGKGAGYWFSESLKYSGDSNEVIVKMQPLFNGDKCVSRVKLNYLLNCPYNIDR